MSGKRTERENEEEEIKKKGRMEERYFLFNNLYEDRIYMAMYVILRAYAQLFGMKRTDADPIFLLMSFFGTEKFASHHPQGDMNYETMVRMYHEITYSRKWQYEWYRWREINWAFLFSVIGNPKVTIKDVRMLGRDKGRRASYDNDKELTLGFMLDILGFPLGMQSKLVDGNVTLGRTTCTKNGTKGELLQATLRVDFLLSLFSFDTTIVLVLDPTATLPAPVENTNDGKKEATEEDATLPIMRMIKAREVVVEQLKASKEKYQARLAGINELFNPSSDKDTVTMQLRYKTITQLDNTQAEIETKLEEARDTLPVNVFVYEYDTEALFGHIKNAANTS